MADAIDSSTRTSLLSHLLARFDTRVLMPPEPRDGLDHANLQSRHAWTELQQWCLSDPAPFSVAALRGPDAAALANLLCLERDGSLRMQATNGAGRLALRLKTKLNDLMPRRARQPSDAWDSGTLITTGNGLAALQHFRPRRATLMVVDAAKSSSKDAGGLAAMLPTLTMIRQTLEQAQPAFSQPVRLLLLGCAADQAWASARTRCIATDAAAVRVSTPSFP